MSERSAAIVASDDATMASDDANMANDDAIIGSSFGFSVDLAAIARQIDAISR